MLPDRKDMENDDTFFHLLRLLCEKGRERNPARLAELTHSFTREAAVQGY
jgi:hypothetical protein